VGIKSEEKHKPGQKIFAMRTNLVLGRTNLSWS